MLLAAALPDTYADFHDAAATLARYVSLRYAAPLPLSPRFITLY